MSFASFTPQQADLSCTSPFSWANPTVSSPGKVPKIPKVGGEGAALHHSSALILNCPGCCPPRPTPKGNGGTRIKFERYDGDYPLPEGRFVVEEVTDDRTPRTMRS